MHFLRRFFLHVPLLGALVMEPCATPQCGSAPNTPHSTATTGLLIINVGFSAASGAACTGSESITVTPVPPVGTTGTNTASTQVVTFSGTAQRLDDRHQGCQATVTLPSMATGTWRVSDGVALCTATITAGNATTVSIWEHVCGA